MKSTPQSFAEDLLTYRETSAQADLETLPDKKELVLYQLKYAYKFTWISYRLFLFLFPVAALPTDICGKNCANDFCDTAVLKFSLEIE